MAGDLSDRLPAGAAATNSIASRKTSTPCWSAIEALMVA